MEPHADRDRPEGAPGFVGAVRAGLATIITLGALAWGADLFRSVGVNILTEQFAAGMLALCLALAFLQFPVRRFQHRAAPPWYDWCLALIGLFAGLYLAVQLPSLVDLVLMRPRDGVIAGALVILLSIEALRRSSGWPLPIMVVIFIIYGLFCDFVPGILSGKASDVQKLTAYLAIDFNGMLGLPIVVASTVIVSFLLFGAMLSASGGGAFLSDLSLALMGRFRGGPGKIAVLASCLFGSISGSAVANVVASGVVTIPMMKKSGYSASRAGAIEAVASTGGQLMPPVMGASAFLIAEFLQISYAEVLLAALIPAILYYSALFIQVDLEAGKTNIAALPEDQIPRIGAVFRKGWYFLIPFVILIMGLFWLNWQPQMAVVAAIIALLVIAPLGYGGGRASLRQLIASIAQTGLGALDIILICAGAGIVIGVLSISGLSFNLTLALVALGAGSLPLLLVVAAIVCIILGMGLPTVGVYVLLAALVAPAMVKMGVLPITAHLYVMYFGLMSFVTPPVAVAAFAAAAIAKADPIATALQSMRLGWTAYIVPFLFVMSPALALQGAAGEVALAVITAVAGVFLGSVGVVGFLLRPLPIPLRLLFFAAGVLALIPSGTFRHAIYTDIVGVLLGVGLVTWELVHRARVAHDRRVSVRDGGEAGRSVRHP